MNPVPFVVSAAVIAVVPPLRRRVAPVAGAVAVGAAKTAATVLVAGAAVGTSTIDAAVGVGRAALRGPQAPAED